MSTLTAKTAARIDSGSISAFRTTFRGRVLEQTDDGYDDARQIWNAMIVKRPALIAQCASTDDIQRAVAFARDHDLLVSIRGGGHNIAGSALCDGGLMIDLSSMKQITVDSQARTAIAQPGLTWAEFDRETQRQGLATTGGAVSTTGIAGLTLGGGVGWLMGRCGFAVDNLLSAEVVLHDASVVTASPSSHPDLFWALRGGGGNFGVVTSFEYRLHPVDAVLAGLLLHPVERLPQMLRFYREFVHSAPDELTVHTGIMTLPTGDRVAAFIMVWSGDLAEGERRLAPLRAFGPPIADMVQAMPYTAAQQMLDAAVPYGRHNYGNRASFASCTTMPPQRWSSMRVASLPRIAVFDRAHTWCADARAARDDGVRHAERVLPFRGDCIVGRHGRGIEACGMGERILDRHAALGCGPCVREYPRPR